MTFFLFHVFIMFIMFMKHQHSSFTFKIKLDVNEERKCETDDITHHKQKKQSTMNSNFSNEELEILEMMKKCLTEKEYQNFIEVVNEYLDSSLSEDNIVTRFPNHESSSKAVENKSSSAEPESFDWSQQNKLTVENIIHSKPERIQQLLRLDFTPRPYQIRMARPGLEQNNSLVCLQTGAGKTCVSILI